MVSIKTLDIPAVSAKSMVVSKTALDLSAYVTAFKNLEADKCLEITPDENESMRKVRLNVAAAAKQAGLKVQYGVTPEDTLILWLGEAEPKRARKSRKLSLVS